MELHRLQPMKPHDPKLFNELYKKTERLRRSLVYQIDASRFGVTPDEIMSWFDDKFLFVFNKYVDKKSPDLLLGFLINSLKVFKLKILRRSYQNNNSVNLNSVSLDDLAIFNLSEPQEEDNKDLLLNLVMSFMETHLSEGAYELLQLQLNPPLFITSKLSKPSVKIPPYLILEFLGLDISPENIGFIAHLRKEISQAILSAKYYFKDYVIA